MDGGCVGREELTEVVKSLNGWVKKQSSVCDRHVVMYVA
jgi:hypothetical protein